MIMPYASEFVYSRYRGPYLSSLSIFWMIGGLLCGGTAWVLLPINITGVSIGAVSVSSWRVFLMLSAIPSLLGAFLFIVMPESPRFLLEVSHCSSDHVFYYMYVHRIQVGKNKKALKILTLMFKINHWRTKKVFPVSLSIFIIILLFKFSLLLFSGQVYKLEHRSLRKPAVKGSS